MGDRFTSELQSIIQHSGNNQCADCRTNFPDWSSYNLGVFLCVECAGIHRNLGAYISKVKTVSYDSWTDDQVQFIASHGNELARTKYERHVPLFYPRPGSTRISSRLVREQWIRAKYERMEFLDEERQSYLSGFKEGILYKKGRGDKKYLPRLFRMESNTLTYYVKQDSLEPKQVISVSDIMIVFAADKMGHPNGMQISFLHDGLTRNIYVYADDGKDAMDWFLAILNNNFVRLQIAFPSIPKEDLLTRLRCSFTKEGYLLKTGSKGTEAFRKRWFTLDDRRLTYFEDKLDAYPKGSLFIAHRSDNFTIVKGYPQGCKEQKNDGFVFTLVADDRVYVLCAETEGDRDQWMEVIGKVIERFMTPQDVTASKLLRRH